MISEEQIKEWEADAKDHELINQGACEERILALIEAVRTLAYDLRHTEAALQRFQDGTQQDFRITLEHLIIKLRKELKAKDELIAKKDIQLRFAAGYISATKQFRDKHPQDALEWIEKEALTGEKSE